MVTHVPPHLFCGVADLLWTVSRRPCNGTCEVRSESLARTGPPLFRPYFSSWRAITTRWIWLVPS